MTGRNPSPCGPILSTGRPWWALVLLAMLGFGLLQEQSKIKVNHYLKVGDEAGFWEDESSMREAWWTSHAPVGRHNFYVSRDTWPFFHGLSRGELVAFKWALSGAILLIFFVLDVLFLRTTGVGDRVPWLVLIYLVASVPMVGLAFSRPGEPWYALARDMLGFLQSPLPSVMVLTIPWFLDRLGFADAPDEPPRG